MQKASRRWWDEYGKRDLVVSAAFEIVDSSKLVLVNTILEYS